MKSHIYSMIKCMLLLTIAAPVVVSAGEETFEGCKITTDNSGRITSMAYGNPETFLGIEAGFLFTVAPDGRPTNGTITFKNGFQRQMNTGEMALHFAQCGGPNTVWDYYKAHGKTVSYFPGTDKVPFEIFGKMSRLITNAGTQYIGKLVQLPDKADGFSLMIEGASGGPLVFTNNTVKEIQQMK
jgi:hypothetical protein